MSANKGGDEAPEPQAKPTPCPEKPDKTGHCDAEEPADVPDGLTPAQGQALEALLQQPTLGRAAAVVGVSERTLRRWLAEPAFRRAVQEARRCAFSQAIGLTQWYASVAVAALVKVVNDAAAPANARVSASATLLRFGRDGIELDDLAERLESLEQAVTPLLGAGGVAPVGSDEEDPK